MFASSSAPSAASISTSKTPGIARPTANNAAESDSPRGTSDEQSFDNESPSQRPKSSSKKLWSLSKSAAVKAVHGSEDSEKPTTADSFESKNLVNEDSENRFGKKMDRLSSAAWMSADSGHNKSKTIGNHGSVHLGSKISAAEDTSNKKRKGRLAFGVSSILSKLEKQIQSEEARLRELHRQAERMRLEARKAAERNLQMIQAAEHRKAEAAKKLAEERQALKDRQGLLAQQEAIRAAKLWQQKTDREQKLRQVVVEKEKKVTKLKEEELEREKRRAEAALLKHNQMEEREREKADRNRQREELRREAEQEKLNRLQAREEPCQKTAKPSPVHMNARKRFKRWSSPNRSIGIGKKNGREN